MIAHAVDIAIDELNGFGAAGDAYHLASESLELTVADGVLEKQVAEKTEGIGIRAFFNGRVGFSYTTSLARSDLRAAIEKALFGARQLPPDPDTILPRRPRQRYATILTEDPLYDAATLDSKVDLVHAIERGARAVDPRVSKFQQSSFQETRTLVSIASTNGIRCSYRSSRAYGSCECAAVDGNDSQVGWSSGWALSAAQLDGAAIGREAGTRAVQKIGADAWATRSTNVILDPWVTSGIMASLAEAFRGDQVLRGKSLLVGKMGQGVASRIVTLIDDGCKTDGSASAIFDDEGWPTQRTVLVEEGVLRSLLHNASSAERLSSEPTGNAAREGFMTPPKIGPTNFYMIPGEHSPEALCALAGEGVLITETMGLHTIDSVTGEFSIAASGLRFSRGVLGGPVNGIAIAGNLIDLLHRVVALGSDLRTFAGGGIACSTLVEGISVAGR